MGTREHTEPAISRVLWSITKCTTLYSLANIPPICTQWQILQHSVLNPQMLYYYLLIGKYCNELLRKYTILHSLATVATLCSVIMPKYYSKLHWIACQQHKCTIKKIIPTLLCQPVYCTETSGTYRANKVVQYLIVVSYHFRHILKIVKAKSIYMAQW